MTWLQNIIHKITNYDIVVKENNSLRGQVEALDDNLETVLTETNNLHQKYSSLKKTYQELLRKGDLDIIKLIPWFESKRNIEKWTYDFNSDGHDIDVKFALRVSKEGEVKLKDFAKILFDKYNPKTPEEIIESLLKYFSLKKNWTYVTDEQQFRKIDYWQLAEISLETRKGDCLIWNTKLLDENLNYVNIEDIKIGDKIIGKDGELVTVKNKWDKGILPTKKIILNNGSEIIATNEHKFLLKNGTEILCKDLKIGDNLKELKELNFNAQIDSKDVHDKNYYYLLGLFIADGWVDHSKKRICISGKDGHPKEKQKEWVKNYCGKKGWKYYWNERYILIHSEELYNDFKRNGTHAINKHVYLIPNEKENIEALLRGLQADAHIRDDGTITYGTISTKLKSDILTLYKKLGVGCHTKLVEPCKTQFGKNPIWRIIPRYRQHKNIKIKGILDWSNERVYDIEVENHEIYLPENGILVHNCDDLAILMHNTAYYMFKAAGWEYDYPRLTFTAGQLVTGGGHAFNTWLGKDGHYYVVESTFDIKGSYHKTWLKTPINNNNLYVKFYGFSTKQQSWKGEGNFFEEYKEK